MDKINQIRENNAKIYERVKQIIDNHNGNVPKEIMEKILTLEQKNIVASYLAMYDKVVSHKDILEDERLGRVQISKTCSSGLNHKTNAVIIGDMSEKIEGITKKEEYGSNKEIKKESVTDMKSYINYMILSGGTELDFYLTTLPHEARHLMGIDGNSGFEHAKGFAEGKNELDTRRAMEYFGFKYYVNRNYSDEVSFVEALETLCGKDKIDELGSFKVLEYEKLTSKYGENFDKFLKLQDQNSIKKDVNLYFESNGKLNVSENSSEFLERAEIVRNERNIQIAEFKRANGIDDATYEEMEKVYKAINNDRNKKYDELIADLPQEIKGEIKKIADKFDEIHGIKNQEKMIAAYKGVSLNEIENYIREKDLTRRGHMVSVDDSKLDVILQVQGNELKELGEVLGIKKDKSIINTTEINIIANNPEVLKEVEEISRYNNELILDEKDMKKENDEMEK